HPISESSQDGVNVSLGEKEQALALLERAYAEGDFRLSGLKTDPDWDRLRSHPRFQRLLRQVNLERGSRTALAPRQRPPNPALSLRALCELNPARCALHTDAADPPLR